MGAITPDPREGTVAFGSALFAWAFTLSKFARIYAQKFKVDEALLMRRLWGENFFNPTTKKFTNNSDDGKGGRLTRTFVQFIMGPIIKLVRACMEGNNEQVFKTTKALGLTFTKEEQEFDKKQLFKCVF
jgi:elongation factor 2